MCPDVNPHHFYCVYRASLGGRPRVRSSGGVGGGGVHVGGSSSMEAVYALALKFSSLLCLPLFPGVRGALAAALVSQSVDQLYFYYPLSLC